MTAFPKVTRWIRGFDRHTKWLAIEHRLSPAYPLERLQELFGIPADVQAMRIEQSARPQVS
jgi:predicted transcriptional regulator